MDKVLKNYFIIDIKNRGIYLIVGEDTNDGKKN